MTREETSAYGNIRHQALPKELQQLIRLTTRLKQEVSNELLGISRKVTPKASSCSGRRTAKQQGRWTPQMDEHLARDFPCKPRWEVAKSLGVTELAVRLRARRLGLQRRPETIMAEARARAAAKARRTRC